MLRLSRKAGGARRRTVTLAMAACAAAVPAVVTATASPAYAYTCSWSYRYLDDGSASASINLGRNCSDGLSHVSGTVWDDKCDGRRGELHLKFFNGSNLIAYRHEYPTASNGCNTSASFSYGSSNKSPYLYGCVYAINGGPTQSSGDCGWIGGSQP